MAELKNWSQVATVNQETAPHGWPEGMKRSDVNDAAREGMAVVRRFYDAPEWLQLLKENGDTYTVSRASATTVDCTSDAGGSSAVTKFPDGARIRLTESGAGDVQYGYVNGTPTYGSSVTTVTVAIDGGTAVASLTNSLEIALVRDLVGDAAYSATGTTLAQTPPQIPTIDDLGTVALLDNGAVNAATLENQTLAQVYARAVTVNRNYAFNPQFKVWQRGSAITAATTAFPNNDNAYTADRWRVLSGFSTDDDNDIVDVSMKTTDVPAGFWSAAELKGTATVTAGSNSERAGLFQVLEGRDCLMLINSNVSFSFYAKSTGTIGLLRGMILKRLGTMDDTAADPVSDWGTAGNSVGPTFTAGWEKVMDTQPITVSGTWTRYTQNVQGIDLSSHTTATNFGILLYIDDNAWTENDTALFTGVQLETQPESTNFQGISHADEMTRCQRYFQKTFDEGTAPAENLDTFAGAIYGVAQGANGIALGWDYAVTMRETPTVAIYETHATGQKLTKILDSADTEVWTPIYHIGTRSLIIFDINATTDVTWAIQATADAEL